MRKYVSTRGTDLERLTTISSCIMLVFTFHFSERGASNQIDLGLCLDFIRTVDEFSSIWRFKLRVFAAQFAFSSKCKFGCLLSRPRENSKFDISLPIFVLLLFVGWLAGWHVRIVSLWRVGKASRWQPVFWQTPNSQPALAQHLWRQDFDYLTKTAGGFVAFW